MQRVLYIKRNEGVDWGFESFVFVLEELQRGEMLGHIPS